MSAILLLALLSTPPAPPTPLGPPAGPRLPAAGTTQPAVPRFGDRGTYAPSGSLSLGHSVSTSGLWATSSRASTPNLIARSVGTTNISIEPGVDYFVWDRIALHLELLAQYNTSSDGSSYALGAGAGAGYYVPLSERFGLFPRAKVSGFYQKFQASQVGSLSVGYFPYNSSHDAAYFTADLPFVAHFGQFFLGAGPRITQRLWQSSDVNPYASSLRTGIQLVTMIGGWLD